MKWTQETPGESGFYWFARKYLSRGGYYVGIIEIRGVPGDLFAFRIGIDVEFSLKTNKPRDNWWWQGPLEKPEFVEVE